jgi:hypothetical protein
MSHTAMILIQVAIGLLVLFYGRQLFWVFVGAVGFMLAMTVAAPFLTGRPEWQVLVVGLAVGALGALCALALERVAVAVAGFLAGGALAVRAMSLTGFHTGPLVWCFILAGGVFGVVMVGMLFDWALIVLSSAVGASLLLQCISTRSVSPAVMFAVILAFGIVMQARQFGRYGRARR